MTDEVKKALKDKNITLGTNEVLRKLRLGGIKKVFVSKNCPNDLLESIKKYAEFAKVDVIKLKLSNEQLGTACKKPFSISIIGY